MGQRLNIEIWNNGEVLASSYYHWSGYTGPTMEMVKKIVTEIENEPLEAGGVYDVLTAISLLEETGAKISPEELDIIRGKFPNESFEVSTSRNDGLITITKEGIDNTRDWAEADAMIYLDTKCVTIGAFYEYDADEIKQLLEEEELDDDEIADAANFELDYTEITFEQFKQLDAFVDKMFSTGASMAKQADGSIVGLIQ